MTVCAVHGVNGAGCVGTGSVGEAHARIGANFKKWNLLFLEIPCPKTYLHSCPPRAPVRRKVEGLLVLLVEGKVFASLLGVVVEDL